MYEDLPIKFDAGFKEGHLSPRPALSLNERSDLQAARTQPVDEKLFTGPFVGNTYTATSSADVATVAQKENGFLLAT